jgi:hypothetical protein
VELVVGLAGWRCVVGEEGHKSDRPHRIGRTERAPSADLLGSVSAGVAAGLEVVAAGGGGIRKKRKDVLPKNIIFIIWELRMYAD